MNKKETTLLKNQEVAQASNNLEQEKLKELEERRQKIFKQIDRNICRQCKSELKGIYPDSTIEKILSEHRCLPKKEPIILLDEFEKDKKTQEVTKITGILTSGIRSRKNSDIPYMAFFRLKYSDREIAHSDAELCANAKCQRCEISVVFRIENEGHQNHLPDNFTCVFRYREFGKSHWTKPNLKKGDSVILEGEFSPSEKSNRPSFTCSAYQIITK